MRNLVRISLQGRQLQAWANAEPAEHFKHLKTQEHSTHTSSPHRLEAVWVLQQRLEGAHQLAVQAPEEAQQALDDVRHEQRLRGPGGGAGSGGRARHRRGGRTHAARCAVCARAAAAHDPPLAAGLTAATNSTTDRSMAALLPAWAAPRAGLAAGRLPPSGWSDQGVQAT